MKKPFLPLVLLLIMITSCAPQGDETVTVIKNGSQKQFLIHTHKIKDSLHLKLSDFAKDFEFIPLETSDDCLISYGVNYHIDDQYYLVEMHHGDIYQFSRSGKFIRIIARRGKGPTEFSQGYWTVDEKKQILYLCDQSKKNYFLRFDLNTGAYLGDLQKAIPGNTFGLHYAQEDKLYVVPGGSKKSCYLYMQDTDGKLMDSLAAPPESPYLYNQLLYEPNSKQHRFQLIGNDTIFTLEKALLKPYLIFDYGRKNPEGRMAMGHMEIEIDKETANWITFQWGTVADIRTNKEGEILAFSNRMSNLALDKKNNKAYYRGRLYIDPVHDPKGFWIHFNKNGQFVKDYDAAKFLELAEQALQDPEFTEPYRSKLEAVIENVSEEDNPILLVGRYK